MSAILNIALCFILAFIHLSDGYGTGAPEAVCENMTPQHGVNAQPLPSPYNLHVNRKKVKSGEKVIVSINGKDGSKLQGFFLQARDPTNIPIGTFESANNVKLINCAPGTNNAATHSNPSNKTRVTVNWIAPKTFKSVRFTLTTAKTAEIFWVGQKSDEVTYLA